MKETECGRKPAIGVVWKGERSDENLEPMYQSIEEAGGLVVKLDQVVSPDLEYDGEQLVGCLDKHGALTLEAAETLKKRGSEGTNAEQVLEGIDAVLFVGGEDISPSLFAEPMPVETKEDIIAERDVSEYILMRYCLDHKVPLLAICRGMQVLSVVCGATMIQDIKDYMDDLGLDYAYDHRNEPETPGAYRDFARHDVTVLDRDSLLYKVTGLDVIPGVPSWHHQAVRGVEGTPLKVTGVTKTSGVDMIEVVELPGDAFVMGLQFHPEFGVKRGYDETSLTYFTGLVESVK